ncbi:hypothetical protein AKO1_011173, partial [Acrasis kona]
STIYSCIRNTCVRYASSRPPSQPGSQAKNQQPSTTNFLVNALEHSKRKIEISKQPTQSNQENNYLQLPIHKDIMNVVKKENRDPSVVMSRTEFVSLHLDELNKAKAEYKKFEPGVEADRKYIRKLKAWRNRYDVLVKGFPDDEINNLIRAFTSVDNEPLAHVGLSVMSECITTMLLKNLPDCDVGEIMFAKHHFTNMHMCASFTRMVGSGEFYINRGTPGRVDQNAIHALVGALHLKDDSLAREFVDTVYIPITLKLLPNMIDDPEHIERLQVAISKKYFCNPQYRIIEEKPSWFVVGLYANNLLIAMNYGTTFEIARENVAKSALSKLE